jgi:CRISPR-associated endoribonuclease Cas6
MISLRFRVTSPFTGRMGFTGIPLRAGFLDMLRRYDRKLSNRVHDASTVRSYSLDPFLFDRNFATEFTQGDEYSFGVNLFDAESVSNAIRNMAIEGSSEIRIHHHHFPVRRIDFERHEGDELMNQWIAEDIDTEERSISIRMRFLTPTQLSQYGTDRACLLPTPEKVFTGLLRVWNTVGRATKVEQPSSYYDWINRNVYVSHHRIRTEKVPLGRSRSVVGFVGNVTFGVESVTEPFGQLTLGLARFAEICNVGKNRTAGLGKAEARVSRRRSQR